MDYEALRQSYPETISMEQFYKIAHIHKRKARWLLENEILPCKDSGKKTNRFKIHMNNVIVFLQRQAAGELEGVIPVGAFSGGVLRQPLSTPFPPIAYQPHMAQQSQVVESTCFLYRI